MNKRIVVLIVLGLFFLVSTPISTAKSCYIICKERGYSKGYWRLRCRTGEIYSGVKFGALKCCCSEFKSSTPTTQVSEITLQRGESVNFKGKIIKLRAVTDKSVFIECNGKVKQLNLRQRVRICGLKIYLREVFNDEGIENDWAILKIKTETTLPSKIKSTSTLPKKCPSGTKCMYATTCAIKGGKCKGQSKTCRLYACCCELPVVVVKQIRGRKKAKALFTAFTRWLSDILQLLRGSRNY